MIVHPTSEVSPRARIGQGTRIWQHCTVLAGAVIGRRCRLSQNVFVENGVTVGDDVNIKNNVSLYDRVRLEDGVFVGPGAVFTNVLTPRSRWPRKGAFLETRVREGATIGANATIVCGTTVGRYALVGAGAVVTSDVPDFALSYGVPASRRGWVCACGELLPTKRGAHRRCSACGSRYRLEKRALKAISLAPPPGDAKGRRR